MSDIKYTPKWSQHQTHPSVFTYPQKKVVQPHAYTCLRARGKKQLIVK